MIHDPAVMILDEPANGLDPRARIELRQMILGLAADGKALLVSSHILTELGEICDALGIIERGRLIACGKVQEILSNLQPHLDLRLQVIDGVDRLAAWLQSWPGVSHLVVSQQTLQFQLHGDDCPQAIAGLLRAIIQQGFDVVEFTTDGRSLEDVFMQITTGAVQ
jgi:ABC-2 type transport system ATP-binding protein